MKKYKNAIPAFVILIFGIIISFGIQLKYIETQTAAIDNEINLLVENRVAAIQHELTTRLSSLEFLKYLFEKNTNLTRKDFLNYASPFLKGATGIKALSWVPKVKLEDREKYESDLQFEFDPNITIWTQNKENQRFISQNKPIYFPVTYIEPIAGNSDAIGYDIYSSGTRKATINKAIEKNELLITSRIKLVQDTSGYGFLGIQPVFHSAIGGKKMVENIDTLFGLLTGAFKVDDLIIPANRLSSEYQFDIVIFDVTNKVKELLYGDEKLLSADIKINKREIPVAGRLWEISFLVNAKYYKVKDALIYLLIGISVSLFLFILFLIPFIKEERSRRLSLKLNEEKQVRRETQQILTESEDYNRALFTQSSIGLALATMDGILVDVNPAFAAIIGRTVKETKKLSYWDITPKKYLKQEEEQLKVLAKKGEYGPYVKEYIHKNGNLVPVRLKGKIIKQKNVKYIWSSAEDITEQKKAELEIVQSENRFRNMFNNALFGAVVNQLIRDESGKAVDFLHLEVNDATEKHLGSKPADIIGTRATEIVSKEEADYSVELFSKVVETGQSCKFERYYKAFDKTIEISAFYLQDDFFITTFIDISERKRSENALVNSEQKFRALVEQSLTGIYIFEKEKFIYVNKRFCEIFGYTEAEILSSLKPTDVVTREEVEAASNNIDKRLDGEVESVRYTAAGKHKEGKTLWIEIHGTHIKYEGKDVITGTVLDITERRLAEEKIRNLNLELEEKVENRTKELNDKLLELERMNGIFINREFRIKELKDKIKDFENKK